MAGNSSEVEQVVARTLRDSLAKLQQTTGELDQAVADLVSACASARPSNSLPSMLRARSAAASLAASLEVLSKFVITALQLTLPVETELLAPLPRVSAPASQREAPEAEAAADTAPVESAVAEPQKLEVAPAAEGRAKASVSVAPESEPAPEEPEEVAPVAGVGAAEKVETDESLAPVLPAAEPLPVASSVPLEFEVATDTTATEAPTFEPPPLAPALELTAVEKSVEETAETEPEADEQAVAGAAPEVAELYELTTWKEPLSAPSPETPSVEAATTEAPTVEAVSLEAPAIETTAPAETPRIDEPEPVAVAAPVLEAVRTDTPATPAASTIRSEELPPEAKGFDVLALSPDQQELHRRANRVAKVSMQDVKMLRPREVALGKEHKDICVRLRDDIEKAHKEYDRRFHTILDHPVDYFYDWMVEILGDGDPKTLGDYPYPSPVLRR